jgi:ubiquinone/menaquinone biosynthesis C-methylase UbiE
VMKHHFDHLSGEESSHYVRTAHSVTTRSRNVDRMEDGDEKLIVDFGCGIGVSTGYLQDTFRNDRVIGLDMSPYFLEETPGVAGVAGASRGPEYIHCNVENTPLEEGTVDVVSISYVLHELPYDVSLKVLREAHRILKPGTGVLSILDMHDPKPSSPLMRYIFNRTEPYLSEYSRLLRTMNPSLGSVGFDGIQTSTWFPKTISILASKKSES